MRDTVILLPREKDTFSWKQLLHRLQAMNEETLLQEALVEIEAVDGQFWIVRCVDLVKRQNDFSLGTKSDAEILTSYYHPIYNERKRDWDKYLRNAENEALLTARKKKRESIRKRSSFSWKQLLHRLQSMSEEELLPGALVEIEDDYGAQWWFLGCVDLVQRRDIGHKIGCQKSFYCLETNPEI